MSTNHVSTARTLTHPRITSLPCFIYEYSPSPSPLSLQGPSLDRGSVRVPNRLSRLVQILLLLSPNRLAVYKVHMYVIALDPGRARAQPCPHHRVDRAFALVTRVLTRLVSPWSLRT